MVRFQTKSFGRDQIICRENDPAECLYILRQGRVAVEVAEVAECVVCSEDGEERRAPGDGTIVAEISNPGAMVGEAGLFLGRRTATLRAVANGTLIEEIPFDQGGFRKLLEQRPDTGFKLCRSLALRLRNLSERMRSASEATHTVHLLYDSLSLSYRSLVNTLRKAEERDGSLKKILAKALEVGLYQDAQHLRDKIKSNQSLFAKALRKKKTDIVELAPGVELFQQGELGKTAYLVQEGAIDVFVGGHFVTTLGLGELIGVTALLLEGPAFGATTVRASEGAQVVPISAAEFEARATRNPEFLYNLAHSLCRRIESENRMACDMTRAVEKELDLLAGCPESCEAAFVALTFELDDRPELTNLVERARSQAKRAVSVRERMAKTYRPFM